MKQRLNNALPDALIVLLLLLVPLILFFQQTIGGKTLLPVDNLYQFEPYAALAEEAGVERPHNPLISDLILQNYAWKLTINEALQTGQLPLWQRSIVGGAPFLAAGQSSVLYPLTLLTILIFNIPATYGWFTVLTLWTAGVNMYIMARVLGLKRGGSLVAALTYQLSGFFIVSVVFPMIIATAAWLPLCLAMVEKTIRQDPALGRRPASLPWVAIGAISLGLATTAGHVEALYFTLLVLGYYSAFRLISEAINRRSEPRITTALARRAGWLLGLALMGIALGAVQVLPAYELASRSFREGAVTFAQVQGWAYPYRRVIAFLVPNFFGNPSHAAYFDIFTREMVPVTVNSLGNPINNTSWGIKNYVEGGAYMGLLPMLLAVVAAGHGLLRWFLSRRGDALPSLTLGGETLSRPYRLIFSSLALLSISFVFGTPLYAIIFYGLPFINQSHSPFRWVWPLTLCVAVLAGIGVQIIMQDDNKRWRKWLGLTVTAAGVLTVLVVLASGVLYPSLAGTIQRVFESLALAPNAFADGQAFFSYQFVNFLIFGVILMACGGVLLLSLSDWSLKVASGTIPMWLGAGLLLIVLDLSVATWGFYPANDPALLNEQPAAITYLQQQYEQSLETGQPWRLIAYEEPGADTLNSNIGWLHGLEDASGYDSLIPGQYADYMRLIQEQGDLAFNRIAPIYDPRALDSPALDLLNVRYVVTETEIESPKFSEVYRDEAVIIYENLGVMPRAFTLPADSTLYLNVGSEALTLDDAVRLYDVRQHVLLDEVESIFTPTPALPALNTAGCTDNDGCAGEIGPAAITVYDSRNTWVDVQVEEARWLIVTDSYFPGWRAFVRPFGSTDDDEVEVDLHLVNGNFQGVLLEPGAYTVRLRYSSDSVRLGAFASFMSIMVLIFAVGVYVWRYAYRDSDEDSTARRVAKNSLTPILLNLFNRGIQFAFAIVSLRILGPDGSGRYQYAVVLWGWFEIMSNFGLDTLLLREVARARENANKYLANTTVMRFVLALLGIPLLFGFIQARQTLLDPPLAQETVTTIWVLYMGLFLSTMSKGLTGLFYAFEKAEYPAAVQTVATMLSASLGLVALLSGYGIVGLAVVSVITNFLTLIALYALTRRMFFVPRFRLDRDVQQEAAGESFPLMLNHLLATIFFRIDIIILELVTRSDTIVGWYGVTYKWVDAINVIPAFFTQALFPVMSRQASEDRSQLKRSYIFSVKLLTLVSLPTAVGTTLLAPFLIGVLGGPEFLPFGAIALQLFVWSIPLGWINSVTNYVIIALNRQRILTWAFIFGALFNIIANLYFIPLYSFPAAAVVTILSEFILLAFFYMVMLEPLGRINWVKAVGKLVVAAAVMATVAFYLNQISMWLAAVLSSLAYLAAIFVLRPFDAFESERILQLMPGRVRGYVAASRFLSLPATTEKASTMVEESPSPAEQDTKR